MHMVKLSLVTQPPIRTRLGETKTVRINFVTVISRLIYRSYNVTNHSTRSSSRESLV